MKKLLIARIAERHRSPVDAVLDGMADTDHHWLSAPSEGTALMICTLPQGELQHVQDRLMHISSADELSMDVVPVEASVPLPAKDDDSRLSRESLRSIANSSARADAWFLLLVALSTLVASFGLIRDNVAVIIGAMVIAPLLGPNLALTLATALGDRGMARDAVVALLLGTVLGFAVALVLGLLWPQFPVGSELASRTTLTYDSALLALAAGMAAVLSLTRGLSSTLVGVMVAVALIPPLATAALYLARGATHAALMAGCVFLVNVAAINLAAQLTFALLNVAPRSTIDARRARRRALWAIAAWLLLLLALLLVPQLLVPQAATSP